MNLDPREKFRTSPLGSQWHDAVATEWFQAGLLAAVSAMSLNRAVAADMGNAAAEQFRMEGARILVNTMMDLCEPKKEPKTMGMPANLRPVK